MELKIGLYLTLPEGKPPEFYAHMVNSLDGQVELFDTDEDMLIFSSEEQKRAALALITQLDVEADVMRLRLLPANAELTDLFSDYGFTSGSEHNYMYDKLVVSFCFNVDSPQSEADQASLQMEEHLLAQYKDDHNREVFVVDRQLEELMQGIAKAYRCRIEMLP